MIKNLREESKKKRVNFTSETIQKEVEVLYLKLETAEKGTGTGPSKRLPNLQVQFNYLSYVIIT